MYSMCVGVYMCVSQRSLLFMLKIIESHYLFVNDLLWSLFYLLPEKFLPAYYCHNELNYSMSHLYVT